ncbi:MAG: pentapeptide repeat-containing protein [Fibromonadaceae bacterium]|nr:pentapeptide repeat-containing protein [Fibromonadaceae bacterium]
MRFLPIILFTLSFCSASKSIKASDITKSLMAGKAVQIKNAVIEGDLDFSKAGASFPLNSAASETQVNFNVYFEKCVFKGKVNAENVRFNSNVIFLDSEFQKEVNFGGATVFGMVNFSKSVFKENADFNQMTVWAKNSYFSEITANKRFSLDGTSFLGNLSLMNAKFAGKFSLQEVFVQENLQSANANFGGATDFAMLRTGNRAIFRYASFKHKPDFSESKFAEAPEM